MTYGLLRWAVRMLCRVYLVGCWTLTGRERVPRSGALVVCPNHIGTIDPALVPAWIDRPDSWSMAKAESLAKPGLGTSVLRAYHAFGVVRHTPDRAALRRAREILHGGGVLFIYPEGHRAWDGRLQQAEPGAAFLARAAGAPVLPVAIIGSNHIIGEGRSFPRRHRLELHIGTPIRLLDRRPDGTRISNQESADAIMVEIARLLPEEMRGAYADRLDDPALRGLAEPVDRPGPAPAYHA